MSDIETLDERIRVKARAELKVEIDRLFAPVSQLMPYGLKTELADANGAQIHAFVCADALRKALIAGLTPGREEKALRQFIERVDTLQSEVEELRAEVCNA